MKQKKGRTKKKEKKTVPVGKAFVQTTYNNTIINLTDMQGNVVSWASSGGEGFKGSRKSTPFAAQMAAKNAAQKAIDSAGLKTVEVYVKGPGIGREAARLLILAIREPHHANQLRLPGLLIVRSSTVKNGKEVISAPTSS